jgi:hypothetical protein
MAKYQKRVLATRGRLPGVRAAGRRAIGVAGTLLLGMALPVAAQTTQGAVAQSVPIIAGTPESLQIEDLVKLLPGGGQPWGPFDNFGFSVAVDGDTAVVGAPLDDNLQDDDGSVHVYVRSGTIWTQQAELHAPAGHEDDFFGSSVAIDGDTILVGSPGDENAGVFGQNAGSTHVFVRSGGLWAHQAKLVASDESGGEQFGAAVGLSGDMAAIGAPFDDDLGSDSGSMYVFERSGRVWSQVAKRRPTDGESFDNFGVAVAIDGETILVGSPGDDDQGTDSGSAYAFTRDGLRVWTEQAKLLPESGATFDSFGESIDMSGDVVVIGAPRDDDNGSDSGSVFVFTRAGAQWDETARLETIDGTSSDNFGDSVAIDGGSIAAGAPGHDDVGSVSGAAYVFVFNGVAWVEQSKLVASSDGAALDNLGGSTQSFQVDGDAVALSGDTVITGAYLHDHVGSDSGSAYAFHRVGSSWSEQAELLPENGDSYDLEFGTAVDLDGDRAVIGAPNGTAQSTGYGAAYVFHFDGIAWSTESLLVPGDGAQDDEFGESVAIDGNTIIVGAPLDDDDGPSSGAAYVFVFNGTAWSQQQKLTASDGAASDQFGESVSVSGDRAVVGSPFEDDIGSSSGSAYVFARSGGVWVQQQKLTGGDQGSLSGSFADFFGTSVAIDGSTIIVGAPGHDHGSSDRGGAYAFGFNGTTWVEQKMGTGTELLSTFGAMGDAFGTAVDLDGTSAIVGAPFDDDVGTNSGGAFVFVRPASIWSQQPPLLSVDQDPNDEYGAAVAISGDRAVVGVPEDDDFLGADSGTAYVWSRTGGAWTQELRLFVSDGGPGNQLSFAVAIDECRVLLGAPFDDAPESAPASDSGSAYLFTLDGCNPSPFTDVGFSLAGVNGPPVLTGTGTLLPASPCSLNLSAAAPLAPAVLFVSLVGTPVPFKGGVLKTTPVLLQVDLATNGVGAIALPFVWPLGANPLTFYVQVAIADAAAIQGVALSNALRADAP